MATMSAPSLADRVAQLTADPVLVALVGELERELALQCRPAPARIPFPARSSVGLASRHSRPQCRPFCPK